MGYYMGDFYAGARGDPGFLGSLFGKIGSLASSFIPGGSIVKTAVSTVGGAIAGRARGVVAKGGAIIAKHPVLSAAGAAGAVGLGAGAAAEKMIGGHRKCKHINPRTGKCRRHMNSCNPRALRRAIRRTHAFAKIAMKTIHIVHPKKKGSFGGFKKKHKR